ncbi:MAG: DUF167 domain-containing protein [Candidatus Solibacter usitatus]|nr:DUF167 domain-containing protein [Candidatus Solibacter usitatus]
MAQNTRARIAVKVQPRAKVTRLAGKLGDAYKMQLAAPPVDGKANDECVRFFAELMGVPKARVRIAIGLTSRLKVVEIDGIAQEAVDRALERS